MSRASASRPDVALANFSYAKLPMVKDLEVAEELLSRQCPALCHRRGPGVDRGAAQPPRGGLAQCPGLHAAGRRVLGRRRRLVAELRHQLDRGRQGLGHRGPAGDRQVPDHRQPDRHAVGPGQEGAVRGREASRHRRRARPSARRRPRRSGARPSRRHRRQAQAGPGSQEVTRRGIDRPGDRHDRRTGALGPPPRSPGAAHRRAAQEAAAVGHLGLRAPSRAHRHPRASSKPSSASARQPCRRSTAEVYRRTQESLEQFVGIGGIVARGVGQPMAAGPRRRDDHHARTSRTWSWRP